MVDLVEPFNQFLRSFMGSTVALIITIIDAGNMLELLNTESGE